MRIVGSRSSGLAPLVGIGALLIGAAGAQAQVDGYHALRQGAPGQLATRPPYPEGRADDVRRPGFNGLLWVGRPCIGGVDTGYPVAWGDPGPGEYGAPENYDPTAYVQIGNTVASITPWEYVHGRGLKNLEEGRRTWLEERGYVGGVRTFVNDLYLYRPAAEGEGEKSASAHGKAPTGDVQPRATIQMPLDVPRFKARMHVQNNRAAGAAAVALLGGGGPVRISRPDMMPDASSAVIRVIDSTPSRTPDTGANQTAVAEKPAAPSTVAEKSVASAQR